MAKMATSAKEAIRIAETYLPDHPLQKELAIEIVKAIELCEAELGADIIRRMSPAVHRC
jgi:hypothetical protein